MTFFIGMPQEISELIFRKFLGESAVVTFG